MTAHVLISAPPSDYYLAVMQDNDKRTHPASCEIHLFF